MEPTNPRHDVRSLLYVLPDSFALAFPLRGQLAWMRAQGLRVEVATQGDERAATAAEREGVDALHAVTIRDTIAPLADARALWQLLRILRSRPFDAIYCNTKKGGLLAALAGRLARVPAIVYVVFGIEKRPISARERRLFRWVERAIACLAHRVVLLSDSNREHFRRERLCPEARAVILGGGSVNGIDMERFAPTPDLVAAGAALRTELAIPAGAFVFAFLGRLSAKKGIRELADAWAKLSAQRADAHLMLLSPPEVEEDLEDAVTQLYALPRVHWLGFRPDVRPVCAAMDCLVLPSHEGVEGFPQVILEAGAMARPVLATRVGGCIDGVVHGRTGWLIPERDADALGAAMEQLVADPERARRWGETARARCKTLFRGESIWQAYLGLYAELADRHRGTRCRR